MVIRDPWRKRSPWLPGRAQPKAERIDGFLKKVQDDLMPEHASEIVAIHTTSGDYVVGKTFHEACENFRARWPHGPRFICRVDGGPALHLRGRS